MIKETAIQELGRLQAKHRDLVQNVETGNTKHLSYLRFWYLENRIKYWSKYLND